MAFVVAVLRRYDVAIIL